MKYKVGDRVRIKSLDWYNENKDNNREIKFENGIFTTLKSTFLGQIMTIEEITLEKQYILMEDRYKTLWTDEMIEGLVEDETPKFKVNDIVCVKNIGWVRITNSYWDSLANEHIYEAIGFNGRGEYDSINQSNIEYQMQPESENPHTGGNKITLDEYKNNDKEWLFNKLAMLDNITALESIQDIFNHLQQSKYPKNYEECCKVLGWNHRDYDRVGYKSDLLCKLQVLLLCRDAYWKLYGEDMGLGELWKPRWNDSYQKKWIINFYQDEINLTNGPNVHFVLVFPTEEMRNVFYENFKDEIEICKELL